MKNFNELKKKLLQDKTVKKAYGDLAPQYALIEMITRKRLKAGLSQETLAQKLGTKQSAIARFESGKTNPTLSFLTNITNALNGKLTISIKQKEPKEKHSQGFFFCSNGCSIKSWPTKTAESDLKTFFFQFINRH